MIRFFMEIECKKFAAPKSNSCLTLSKNWRRARSEFHRSGREMASAYELLASALALSSDQARFARERQRQRQRQRKRAL
jgi:hypothetical protein